MKTLEQRAAEFAEIITKPTTLEGEALELQKELIKQCYIVGAEESHQWYSFEDETPPKDTRVNTMDIHGDVISFIFKSGEIKLSAKMMGFVKWKPINLL